MNEFWLVPIAFLTSSLTAMIGMGGGVLLITMMPGLVPPAAIIPVHASTQFASNISRAVFGWRQLDPGIIPAFILGALAGIWVGGGIYQSLNLEWLPALMGVLILVITWVPLPVMRGGGQFALAGLGFYQTSLGMVVGATGPLGAAVLMQRNQQRDWLVVNTAVYMTLNHGLRVAAFVALGFSFAAYWQLIGAMVVAVIAGSWLGTRLRSRIPQWEFQKWFRWLVTLLALRMIAVVLL